MHAPITNMGDPALLIVPENETLAPLFAFGFTEIGRIPEFITLRLPEEWTKLEREVFDWYDLQDNTGRMRISAFYQEPKIRYHARYEITFDFRRVITEHAAVCFVTDGKTIVYETEPVQVPAAVVLKLSGEDTIAYLRAAAWLDQQYPQWRNPLAYWPTVS